MVAQPLPPTATVIPGWALTYNTGMGITSISTRPRAAVVALGLPIADPIIGLIITLVILRITWDSWHTVREAPVNS